MEGPEPRTQPDGSTQQRWIQRVWVIRGDRKAKHETDFGPAIKYPDATPCIYPSFGENSVGELQGLAERDRASDKWSKRRKELQSESTLIADIIRQEEMMIQDRQNRSQFGPLISKQRNEIPSQAIASKQKEKRNARAANYRA